MAYEFKKLSDVNVIEEMKDGLNVLVEDGGEIVKISANSMIPEDVALNSDIPTKVSELENDTSYISAPVSASVGQIIVVKAVDDNGKPTEWETKNADSGDYDLFIVVANSTNLPPSSEATISIAKGSVQNVIDKITDAKPYKAGLGWTVVYGDWTYMFTYEAVGGSLNSYGSDMLYLDFITRANIFDVTTQSLPVSCSTSGNVTFPSTVS